MKIPFLAVVLLLSGCAVKPQNYDLNTSDTFPPLPTIKNITNLEVDKFTYEPNVAISQYSISALGCAMCSNDGSSQGFVFSSPISEIVRAEVKKGLDEVIIPTDKPECKLNATVHLAAWNGVDGDSTVDLTYIITKQEQIKFIKRIRGYNDASVFAFEKVDRILAKATRNSVGQLVTDGEFLNTLKNHCNN